MAKSIYRKLLALAKKSGCGPIKEWAILFQTTSIGVQHQVRVMGNWSGKSGSQFQIMWQTFTMETVKGIQNVYMAQ